MVGSFAACGGGKGGNSPTPTPTQTPIPSPTATTEILVLPSNAETTEGGSANSAPFFVSAARFQAVYGTALLGSLAPGSEITGIRFRLDASSAAFANAFIEDLEIRLSTSQRQPGSLSSNFAMNRGQDEVVVRDGFLAISPDDYPSGSSPNGFGPWIPFVQPFTYEGGPLLLEIGLSGMQPSSQARLVDNLCCALPDSESAYGTADGFATTTADGGLFQDLIVTEYLFTPR